MGSLGLFLLLAGLLTVAAVVVWLWLQSSRAFIADRVRVELEQRLAERQVERITFLALQRMLDEARRTQGLS